MPPLAECLGHVCAAYTCLARAVWIYLYKHATSIFRFVRDHVQEIAPSGIIDGLRQHPGGESFNVQIFDGDHAVVIDKPSADLVMKVRALVSDMNMRPLEKLYGLSPAIASLLTSCHLALRASQFRLRLSVVARAVYLRAVRQRGECGQANVNAYLFRAGGERLQFTLAREYSKPSTRFTLNGQCLNLPFNRPVEFDFNFTDLRESQAISIQSVADLAKRDAVVASERAEAREARCLFRLYSSKESVEGQCDAFQHAFKGDGIYPCDIITELFNFGKLKGLVKVRDGLLVDAPRISALLKGSVIEFATKRKLMLKNFNLSLGRCKPVSVSLEHG